VSDAASSIDFIARVLSIESLRAREPDSAAAVHDLHVSWYRLVHLLLGGELGWKPSPESPMMAAAHHIGAVFDVLEYVVAPLSAGGADRDPGKSGRPWLIENWREASTEHIADAGALDLLDYLNEASIRLCWAAQIIAREQAVIEDDDDPRGPLAPPDDASDLDAAYYLLLSCAVSAAHAVVG